MVARVVLALLVLAGAARADVEYALDLAGRADHRVEVEMIVRSAPAPLELAMPVWTPGAYEVRTWGRNVTPGQAVTAGGQALVVRRTGPSGFVVEGHPAGAEVRLRYGVFANLLSDDGSQVDREHVYLNGTSIFLAARGAERTLHRVRLEAPEGWRVHTPLEEAPGGALVALGYEALIDAPIEIGRAAFGEIAAAGRTYRVVIDGAEEVPPRLLRDLGALAEAEARLVGPPPYKRYLLLLHLSDGARRYQALEHAAAASVIAPPRCLKRDTSYEELLYVAAHELYHTWNARKLRPRELWPYDFSRAVPARSLWITEGLTEYAAHRAMLGAGLWTRAQYLERLSREATRAVRAARQGLSLEEAAELAWHGPDETGDDPDAYYARGHLVALALDAALRANSDGKQTLDGLVRGLIARADRQGGVLAVDTTLLAAAAAAAAGAEVGQAVSNWTQKPHEPSRLTGAVAGLGLELAFRQVPVKVGLDIELGDEASRPRVTRVLPGGPAESSGVRAGDRLLTLDGLALPRRLGDLLATRTPGALLDAELLRGRRRLRAQLRLEVELDWNAELREAPAAPRTALLRDAWLSP
jgi:predicted metalloprotease with PDZ domain